MIASFVFIILGVYIGQEYAILPNVKILTLHVLSYIKNNIDNIDNIDNINDNKNTIKIEEDTSYYSFIIKKIIQKLYGA